LEAPASAVLPFQVFAGASGPAFCLSCLSAHLGYFDYLYSKYEFLSTYNSIIFYEKGKKR
jgi:hypothetical protein